MVGNAAGLTVIVLDTDCKARPQISVAVQVSVTVPPHAPGVAEKVELFEVPEIKQFPLNPLVNVSVLGEGNAPQATVILDGAIIVGNVAGFTVIVLETFTNDLPHSSVAVQVSVTSPPQASGMAESTEAFEYPEISQIPV